MSDTQITVELGNPRPAQRLGGSGAPLVPLDTDAPTVTKVHIPQQYTMPDVHDDSLFPDDLAQAVAGLTGSARRMVIDGYLAHPSGVKGFPAHEALAAVIHPIGAWRETGIGDPTWVRSSHPALEALLAEHYGCPAGYPADLEDTHYTRHGLGFYPPGQRPPIAEDPLGGVTAMHTTAGNANQALVMGGFGIQGITGVGASDTATTFTPASEAGGPGINSHTLDDCAGMYLIVGAAAAGTQVLVYGLITHNTAASPTVYTVDQWYLGSNPGSTSPAATPAGTGYFMIVPGGPPAIFCGLSTDTATVLAGDQLLASEITTAGGGLIRKICATAVITHPTASTYVLVPVFTANGSDVFGASALIGKAGLSPSILPSVSSRPGSYQTYQTKLGTTAQLSQSGDQLTLTWTITTTTT